MTADESRKAGRSRRVDRERVVRTLTFWLRPEFVLRVVNRFQKVAGFDRAIALASGALTATIPLTIVDQRGGHAPRGQGHGGPDHRPLRADRRRRRGGQGRLRATRRARARASGILGVLFLMLAVLSFTRAVQRLFEQTWELSPLSVRNTFNGLLWIGGLALYLGLSGVHPRRAGPHAASSSPPRSADRAAVGRVPRLDRPGPQRQAARAPGPHPVRHPRIGVARGVLGRRDRVRPAPVQHATPPATA